MYSIFNLQCAFDPRHLSIDKEENEPIGGLKFFLCCAGVRHPGSGPDTGVAKYPRNLWPIPQLKNFFFCTSTLNLIDFHSNEAPPALLPPLIPQSNSSGPGGPG